MDKQQVAYQKLIKGIQDFVQSVVNKTADKTYVGIIKKVNSDGTYAVELNRITYDNVPTAIGNACTVNESVYVVVPQGNMNNLFILK